MFFVIHMFDLAGGLYDEKINNALFLRAERREDGTRTFKLLPGAPLRTSYGTDLYRNIFATPAADAPCPGEQSRGEQNGEAQLGAGMTAAR